MPDFKYYIIYSITNILNGKIYVGFHATNDLNDNYMGSEIAINEAYKKYGIDKFKKDILEYCNRNNWGEREKYWIRKLNTYGKGYNLTLGGEGTLGVRLSHESRRKISDSKIGKPSWNKNKAGIYSEKTIKKWSEKRKNIFPSEEHKTKISISNTGKKKTEREKSEISRRMKLDNPGKGIEVRKKVSDSMKGKFTGKNNPMSGISRSKRNLGSYEKKGISLKGDRWEYMRKKIKCIDLLSREEFIFDGVKDMEEKIGVSKNKYYRALKDPSILPKYRFENII
jgi:hypothetical protein